MYMKIIQVQAQIWGLWWLWGSIKTTDAYCTSSTNYVSSFSIFRSVSSSPLLNFLKQISFNRMIVGEMANWSNNFSGGKQIGKLQQVTFLSHLSSSLFSNHSHSTFFDQDSSSPSLVPSSSDWSLLTVIWLLLFLLWKHSQLNV